MCQIFAKPLEAVEEEAIRLVAIEAEHDASVIQHVRSIESELEHSDNEASLIETNKPRGGGQKQGKGQGKAQSRNEGQNGQNQQRNGKGNKHGNKAKKQAKKFRKTGRLISKLKQRMAKLKRKGGKAAKKFAKKLKKTVKRLKKLAKKQMKLLKNLAKKALGKWQKKKAAHDKALAYKLDAIRTEGDEERKLAKKKKIADAKEKAQKAKKRKAYLKKNAKKIAAAKKAEAARIKKERDDHIKAIGEKATKEINAAKGRIAKLKIALEKFDKHLDKDDKAYNTPHHSHLDPLFVIDAFNQGKLGAYVHMQTPEYPASQKDAEIAKKIAADQKATKEAAATQHLMFRLAGGI